jgi:hypothetical protein
MLTLAERHACVDVTIEQAMATLRDVRASLARA